MDRFGAGLLRSRENRIDQEIRILRRRRADANGLVGLAHMQRLGIRVAIDRDRAIAETLRAADHAQRARHGLGPRAEERTPELPSPMRASCAAFCARIKNNYRLYSDIHIIQKST